ncbi:zinc-binding dehydrogenase [Saccharothrix luteola]|uniref:zinc-binding dehydrogenase n=1 Tax=Saccharothrix luteola TaxID=2893018 RepID=UPI001E582CBB|nr:zinc-binding dehydrogenase [Saccharothrix luteola]MCC8242845.1 zinc-binding dehydrogenase [Saccharothrix luteola]
MDPAESRREAAKRFGADVTVNAADDVERLVAGVTGGMGAELAVEAAGVPETFELRAADPPRWPGRERRRARQARDARVRPGPPHPLRLPEHRVTAGVGSARCATRRHADRLRAGRRS